MQFGELGARLRARPAPASLSPDMGLQKQRLGGMSSVQNVETGERRQETENRRRIQNWRKRVGVRRQLRWMSWDSMGTSGTICSLKATPQVMPRTRERRLS